jgi:hypothetical protein
LKWIVEKRKKEKGIASHNNIYTCTHSYRPLELVPCLVPTQRFGHPPIAMSSFGATAAACHRLPKTVHDGPMLVTFVGEEGTGHHGMCSLVAPWCKDHCAGKTKGKGPHLDLSACKDILPCFRHDEHVERHVKGLLYAHDYDQLNRTTELLFQTLRTRLAVPEGQDYAHLTGSTRSSRWLFQCLFEPDGPTGYMASYPDAYDAYKARLPEVLAYPDVVALAAIAERARLDFRVVRLARDPVSSVLSKVRKHPKASLREIARYHKLFDTVIAEQLRCLDEKFTFVLNYSAANEPQTATELAGFLRADAESMRAARSNWHPSSRSQLIDEESRKAAAFTRMLFRRGSFLDVGGRHGAGRASRRMR